MRAEVYHPSTNSHDAECCSRNYEQEVATDLLFGPPRPGSTARRSKMIIQLSTRSLTPPLSQREREKNELTYCNLSLHAFSKAFASHPLSLWERVRVRAPFARLQIIFFLALLSFTVQARLTPEQRTKLPAPATEQIDFAKHIQPIIEKSCVKCHGKGRDKGNFVLETRETLLKGGDSGPAVIVGNSAESLLIELVSGLDPDNVMPDKGTKLSSLRSQRSPRLDRSLPEMGRQHHLRQKRAVQS